MKREYIDRYQEFTTRMRAGFALSMVETREFFNILRMGLGKHITNTTCVSCIKSYVKQMDRFIELLNVTNMIEEPVIVVEEVKEKVVEVFNKPIQVQNKNKNKNNKKK